MIDFHAASPVQPANGGGFDAFVTKLGSNGNLVLSTYLGGSGDDFGNGVAVDAGDNIYVTGTTVSSDFPVSAIALDPVLSGPGDAFVSKIGVTPRQCLAALIAVIKAFKLRRGVESSLLGPLHQAEDLLNDANPRNDKAVCGKMDAFLMIVHVYEQHGKLSAQHADHLRTLARCVKDGLGCRR